MSGSDRELRLDLLARDQTGAASKSASRNLDGVADSADDAAKATDRLGVTSDKTVDRVRRLDREIGLVEHELRGLHEAFADTDDAAARIDLSKGIRRMENDLKRMGKSRGVLAALLPEQQVEPAARSFMMKLGGGLVSAGMPIAAKAGASVGPTVGIAIGAAAAPVLASTLAATLSSVAGAGVIGGAIALALKDDDQLAAAGTRTGQKFMQSLTKGVRGSGIQQPILQTFGILEDAGERFVTKFTATIGKLNPAIVPLTRDVVQGVERISDALLNVAGKSGPALAGLGDSLRLMTDGVGDFLETVADGGPEAADNLRMVAGATADMLRYSGLVLKTFNDLSTNPWISGAVLPLLRKHYEDTAAETDNLVGSQAVLRKELTNAERAATGQRTALAGLAKEMRAQTDPVFGLLNAVDTLAEKQDKAAEAAKKHGANSKEADKANRELAESALDLQGRVGALGATFNGTMTPALRATLRAAGLTDAQINSLEKQFQDAKKKGDAFSKTYAANLKVTGVSAAKNQLWSVKDLIDDIPRAVNVAMKITGSSNVSAAAAAVRKNAREFGGPVKKGHAYVVGEKRAEVFVPDRDGKIVPSIEQYARAGHAASGGGGGIMAAGVATGGTLRLVVQGGNDDWLYNVINLGIRNGKIRVEAA